jgi:hypothetical protein
MKTVLAEGTEIPWNVERVKDMIWRKVQFAMTKKKSTRDLTRKEVGEVYDVINRHLINGWGVSVPFPTIEIQK